MDKIILFGSGGHATSCIDIIENRSDYEVAGFIVKNGTNKKVNLRYPILGNDNDLSLMRKHYDHALICIGQITCSKARVKSYKCLTQLDYILPVLKSNQSYVSKSAKIGQGTIIMHGAIVNANAKIGNNCIINSGSLVEHDVIIGNHCHIATGALVNGSVKIGNESFIGSEQLSNSQ